MDPFAGCRIALLLVLGAPAGAAQRAVAGTDSERPGVPTTSHGDGRNMLLSHEAGAFRGEVGGLVNRSHGGVALLVCRAEPRVIELGPDGGILWQHAYSAAAPYSAAYYGDYGFELTDAGAAGLYAVAILRGDGGSPNDCWAMRLDPSGAVVWSKRIRGLPNGNMINVSATPLDGGLVVALTFGPDGTSASFDVLLARLDLRGEVLWCRRMTNAGASALGRAEDGGLFLAYTAFPGQESRVASLDPGGGLAWAKSLGGAYSLTSLVGLPDGGVVLTANGAANVLRLGPGGDALWSRTVLPGFVVKDCGFSDASGIEVVGEGSWSAYLVRFDLDGAVTSSARFPGGPNFGPEYDLTQVARIDHGAAWLAGTYDFDFEDYGPWVLRLQQGGLAVESCGPGPVACCDWSEGSVETSDVGAGLSDFRATVDDLGVVVTPADVSVCQ